jgi:hypothetical protein
MTPHAFDSANRIRYKNGDKVEIAVLGDTNDIATGKIIGIASESLVTWWVVILDHGMADFEWSAFVAPHYNIRHLGCNEPFLCEPRCKESASS